MHLRHALLVYTQFGVAAKLRPAEQGPGNACQGQAMRLWQNAPNEERQACGEYKTPLSHRTPPLNYLAGVEGASKTARVAPQPAADPAE